MELFVVFFFFLQWLLRLGSCVVSVSDILIATYGKISSLMMARLFRKWLLAFDEVVAGYGDEEVLGGRNLWDRRVIVMMSGYY